LQEAQGAGGLVGPLGEDSSAASSDQEQSSLVTRSRKAWRRGRITLPYTTRPH